jgi:hypothetical protein
MLHRPGLWVFYGIRAPAPVRKRNKIVILFTVLMVVGTSLSAPRGSRLMAFLAVWGVGHLLWGVYLAFTVRNQNLPQWCRDTEQAG